MTAHRLLRTVALVSLAGAMAACGSTVQAAGSQAEAVVDPGAGSLGAPAGVDPGVAGTGPTDASGVDVREGTATSGVDGYGGAVPTATGQRGVKAAPDPGTADAPSKAVPGGPLLIGVELEQNADASRAAFGVRPEGAANNEDIYQGIANWLNERGGIGGRKVELAFHYTDLNSGTFDAQAQATCEAFTRDRRAFAIVSAVNRSQLLPFCLAKAQVPLFAYRLEAMFSPAHMREIGSFLYLPFHVGYERGRVLVDGLHEQGFFAKDSKIGVMTLDHPTYRSFVQQVIKPRLRAHGLDVSAESYLYVPPGLSGLSETAADVSSAVLQFRSRGIDRVLFANTAGVGPFFFLPQADSQNYHPKYGIGSWEYPQTFVQTAPRGQLVNVSGLTWAPTWDLGPSQQPKPNRSQTLCQEIVRKAGGSTLTKDRPCDAFFLLRHALAGGQLRTPTDLQRAVEALGRRYESQYVFTSQFGPGRHDGAGAYRQLRFQDTCGCFINAGPVRPVG